MSDFSVLGVDTSLRSSGIAVVESCGTRMLAREYTRLRIPQKEPLSECLRRIYEAIAETIRRHTPVAVAVEGIFYCKNVKTAVILGESRGAVIAAASAAGISIYEYAPRRVKQAVVGAGGASKEQVRRMVSSLLGLAEEPQEDEADALAIALCHLHQMTRHAALAPKPL